MSISDLSSNQVVTSSNDVKSLKIAKPPRMEDPIHLKKLIEDRKKEIREKIMQPNRIGNLKQAKPTIQNKVQKKIRNMLEGSPQRKSMPGIQSSVKRYTGLGGSLKGYHPHMANISILDNQLETQTKRQTEVHQPTKSPQTLSVSLKGPSKIDTTSMGSMSGSFLAAQQTGQYNILNEILMAQHQPKQITSTLSHHRVTTQPQMHVTISKPGALSTAAARMQGTIKSTSKGPLNFGGLGSSFSSSAAIHNHMASIPASSAIKATPNRSTNQTSITNPRPTPLHKKL